MPPREVDVTDEEYRLRYLALTEGKDPLVMQRQAPETLARLVAGASGDALRRPPAPGKWSVAEIVGHLVDDEIVSSWRYRRMIEQSGSSLQSFNQEEWVRMGDHNSARPAETIELFRLLRHANLRLLAKLSEPQWECCGIHAQRGRITVRDLVRHMAGHDINHIEQVERILGASAAVTTHGAN